MGASSSKGPRITKHDRAVLDLKLQRDKLRQYQTKLQIVLDKEYEIARDAIAAGRKTQARLALQRRAYQRGLIDRTENQLTTLLELVSTIEFAQLEQSVMHGLEQGNQVLKEIHKETNLERVDALMDQTAEAQYYQREIDDRLASKLSADEQEEVERELAALAAEAQPQAEAETKQQTIPTMPSAPTTVPSEAQETNPIGQAQLPLDNPRKQLHTEAST